MWVKTKRSGSNEEAARWRPMEVTESDLEAQRSTKAKSGFKGVKVTSSRKYQPQIWCPELGTMRRGIHGGGDGTSCAWERGRVFTIRCFDLP